MNEWLVIIGMTLATLAIRYPVIAMSGALKLSPQFLKALSYVPPVVLTAIVVPSVLIADGNHLLIHYTNARLVGAMIAVIVGLWQNNLLLTIGLGMLTFFGWQWLLTVI